MGVEQSFIKRNINLVKEVGFRAGAKTVATKDAPTAYSETAGMISIFNGATGNEDNVIIPRHIVLRATTANTSATDFKLHFYTSQEDRYSSGGSSLTPDSLAVGSSHTQATSEASVYVGDLTLTSSTTENEIGYRQISEDVLAAEEVLEIIFYLPEEAALLNNLANNQIAVPAPVLLPGGCLTIHEEAESQAADPAFDMEIYYLDFSRS
jgi:hypothetical protein